MHTRVLARPDVSMFFDEFGDEQRNVVAPLGEPGHVDANLVQPEIQVLSEPSFLDRVLEIDVRGGDNANVGVEDLIAAVRPQKHPKNAHAHRKMASGRWHP